MANIKNTNQIKLMQVVKLLKKSKTKLNYWRAIKNDGACKLNQILFENKSKKKKNYRKKNVDVLANG